MTDRLISCDDHMDLSNVREQKEQQEPESA
jgi:hypothetical protein